MPLSPEHDDLVKKIAAEQGMDPNIVRAIIEQESSGRPNAIGYDADGKPQGRGLMQLVPSTFKEMNADPAANIMDPETNIRAGTGYIKKLLDRYGNLNEALFHYGPGNQQYVNQVINRLPDGHPDMVANIMFGSSQLATRQTTKVTPASTWADTFGSPAAPAAPAPTKDFFAPIEGSRGLKTWGDTIGDIVVDQLDPLNLALLAASFPVGGWAYKFAAKAVGAELIDGIAYNVAKNALTATGKQVVSKALLPRLAEGAAIGTMFAGGELLQTPPEGSSRIGQFARAAAFNEIIDLGLNSFGIAGRLLGRARDMTSRTFDLTMKATGNEARASADAVLSKLEFLRAQGVPDEMISKLVDAARMGVSEDTATTLSRLHSEYGPQIYTAAQKLGLKPEQVSAGLEEFVTKLNADFVTDRLKRGEAAAQSEKDLFDKLMEHPKVKKALEKFDQTTPVTERSIIEKALKSDPEVASTLEKLGLQMTPERWQILSRASEGPQARLAMWARQQTQAERDNAFNNMMDKLSTGKFKKMSADDMKDISIDLMRWMQSTEGMSYINKYMDIVKNPASKFIYAPEIEDAMNRLEAVGFTRETLEGIRQTAWKGRSKALRKQQYEGAMGQMDELFKLLSAHRREQAAAGAAERDLARSANVRLRVLGAGAPPTWAQKLAQVPPVPKLPETP